MVAAVIFITSGKSSFTPDIYFFISCSALFVGNNSGLFREGSDSPVYAYPGEQRCLQVEFSWSEMTYIRQHRSTLVLSNLVSCSTAQEFAWLDSLLLDHTNAVSQLVDSPNGLAVEADDSMHKTIPYANPLYSLSWCTPSIVTSSPA